MKCFKKVAILGACLAAMVMSGCAQLPENVGQDPRDPLEALNRRIYEFNQGVDYILFTPIAKGYQFITPQFAREGITRMFKNTMEPCNAVNNVLQGKVEDGILSLFRLMINSTVGIAGFFDVASEVDIPRKEEDMGQTFAKWGIPNGPFIMLPFFGPSTFRDGIGLIPDLALDPNFYVDEPWVKWPWWGMKYVSIRERLFPVTDMLASTVDPYIATRDAYLANRISEINDGNVPASESQPLLNPLDYDDDDSPKAPDKKGD